MSPTSGSHPVDADEGDDEGEERQTPQEEDEHLLKDAHFLVVRSWNEECSIVIRKSLLSWELNSSSSTRFLLFLVSALTPAVAGM